MTPRIRAREENRVKNRMKPTDIIFHRASHVLEVAFENGERYKLPCEYLRVESPSAEVQGHGPGQRILVPGKKHVNINAIEPVGNYAVQLHFDDGHNTGIFSWTLLRELGQGFELRWAAYQDELLKRGLSREP